MYLVSLAPHCVRVPMLVLQAGTARKRTSSRLRRTNDRSVLNVHEDHEDDETQKLEFASSPINYPASVGGGKKEGCDI